MKKRLKRKGYHFVNRIYSKFNRGASTFHIKEEDIPTVVIEPFALNGGERYANKY